MYICLGICLSPAGRFLYIFCQFYVILTGVWSYDIVVVVVVITVLVQWRLYRSARCVLGWCPLKRERSLGSGMGPGYINGAGRDARWTYGSSGLMQVNGVEANMSIVCLWETFGSGTGERALYAVETEQLLLFWLIDTIKWSQTFNSIW